MTKQTQTSKAEMPSADPGSRGQNPRGNGEGVSNVTGRRDNYQPGVDQLMEAVVERANMLAAMKQVIANKGAAGVDNMSVGQLKVYLRDQWREIKEDLLEGRYQPRPVLGVEIPKPGGKGMRKLGIPTVVDRMIQQALVQALTPVFDPDFSDSSYGFRPRRSALQAVGKARQYVCEGMRWTVDMDLEKFFDCVNHDKLMSCVKRKVSDKRVLGLINKFLQAGVMVGGVITERTEGTPQGGPLSPLLSNILLDDLDKELENRGHAFVRYADDCNIYVHSKEAGERVMKSITHYLATELRLKVNEAKSAVDRPWNRKFLGYSMTAHKAPKLKVAKESVTRLKDKIREIFQFSRGQSIPKTIENLTVVLRGWINYFRLAETKKIFEELDGWIRRKLRATLWQQWKRTYTRAKNLIKRGLPKDTALKSAMNGKGAWWNSGASHMNKAYPKSYFDKLGLVSLTDKLNQLQTSAS